MGSPKTEAVRLLRRPRAQLGGLWGPGSRQGEVSISGPQAPDQHCAVTCLGFGLWDGVSSRTPKQGDDKGGILYT